nr:hypothetical protein [Microctonus hyperodae filamentous virus]
MYYIHVHMLVATCFNHDLGHDPGSFHARAARSLGPFQNEKIPPDRHDLDLYVQGHASLFTNINSV